MAKVLQNILLQGPNRNSTATKTIKWFCLLLLFCSSCAVLQPRKTPKAGGSTPADQPEVGTPVPRENRADPSHAAAAAMLVDGREALANGEVEKAEWHFRNAMSVAPDYGPAYYWLAQTKLHLNDTAQARALFERAELLLADDPAWTADLERLEAQINSSTP